MKACTSACLGGAVWRAALSWIRSGGRPQLSFCLSGFTSLSVSHALRLSLSFGLSLSLSRHKGLLGPVKRVIKKKKEHATRVPGESPIRDTPPTHTVIARISSAYSLNFNDLGHGIYYT